MLVTNIYYEQFFQICHDRGITNDRDIATLLGYFHDLGIVLHFADCSLLRDRVILKSAWATNAVYRIFDNDVINAKQGRFTRTDCSALWSDDQYNHMHDVLIELMKNFLLVYEIENTGNLIAPQMLPQNTPDYDWDDTNNSLMEFRYDLFMPKGILWQFIVTMYRYIKNHDWVWRNGVILERDGTSAEVRENLFERRIYLRFSGTSIAEFRAIIADRLDEISQSYHKLQYEKMIPCPCSRCLHSSEPHFFEFSALKQRQEERIKDTIECVKSGKDISLNLLLEGFERPSNIKQSSDNKNQNVTKIEQHFHGNVGIAPGKMDGNQNLGDVNMEGDRNINKGNYNENIQGNYYEQSGNFGIGHMSGGEIKDNAKVAGVINEAEQQNLAQAAADIQALLEQLEKTYPTNTFSSKVAIANEAIQGIDNDPKLTQRILSALKAGGTSALDSLLDHPAASFVIGALEDWQQTKGS